jgi:hypothetical protein
MTNKCSSHVTGDALRRLGENHAKILTFTWHTTYIFQVIDLSFIGVAKARDKFWME